MYCGDRLVCIQTVLSGFGSPFHFKVGDHAVFVQVVGDEHWVVAFVLAEALLEFVLEGRGDVAVLAVGPDDLLLADRLAVLADHALDEADLPGVQRALLLELADLAGSQLLGHQQIYTDAGALHSHSQVMNDQVDDIDEAKMVISMKNDQIRSLQASNKKDQMKTKIRVTELSTLLQQAQSKMKDAEKKYGKQLEEEREKGRQRVRQLEAELNCLQMKHQEEKQGLLNGLEALSFIRKYFNPPEVKKALGVDNVDSLVPYIQLHKKNLALEAELKEIVGQSEEKIQEAKKQMQELWQRLQVGQQATDNAVCRQKQLNQQIERSQTQIAKHKEQYEKEHELLQCYKQEAALQLNRLNQELTQLQELLSNRQDQQEQLLVLREQNEALSSSLVSLETNCTDLQQTHQAHIGQLQNEINSLTVQLMQSSQTINQLHQQEESDYSKDQAQIEALEEHILKLNQHISDQGAENDKLEEELCKQERRLEQAQQQMMVNSQALQALLKIKQQYEEREVHYQEQLALLAQEVAALQRQMQEQAQYLPEQDSIVEHRMLNKDSSQINSQMLAKASSRIESLRNIHRQVEILIHTQEEGEHSQTLSHPNSDADNWPEMYYALLHKHNTFVKSVQERLIRLTQSQQHL